MIFLYIGMMFFCVWFAMNLLDGSFTFLAGRRLNKSNHPEQKPRSSQSFPIVVQEHEEWTAQDVALLRVYFLTQNGQKLYKMCRNHCLDEAMKECAGDNAAPVAAGMDKLLRFQQNLCSEKMEQSLLSRAELVNSEKHTTDGLREADSVET